MGRNARPRPVPQFPWFDRFCSLLPDGDLWAFIAGVLQARGPESASVRNLPARLKRGTECDMHAQ
eukprot:5338575-Alexandrium_andersonii.AAC.1